VGESLIVPSDRAVVIHALSSSLTLDLLGSHAMTSGVDRLALRARQWLGKLVGTASGRLPWQAHPLSPRHVA
jgi:hypothetical protein